MNLAVRTETLAINEKHSWLASKHGTDATRNTPKVLDGAAFGAVYTDGLAKSGTILALNTSTNKVVLYVDSGANGTGTPIGILYTSIDLRDGVGGFVDTPASMLVHGIVYKAKLPRTNVQTGGPYAAAMSGLPNIQFR